MACIKTPDNQLDMFAELTPPEKKPIAKPESKHTEESTVADQVISEIYEKIEAARNRAIARDKMEKSSELMGVRDAINAEQNYQAEVTPEVTPNEKEKIETTNGENGGQDLSPSEEYFGRFNQNIGKKIINPYGEHKPERHDSYHKKTNKRKKYN